MIFGVEQQDLGSGEDQVAWNVVGLEKTSGREQKSPVGLEKTPGKTPPCPFPGNPLSPRCPSARRDDGQAQKKQLLLRWCQGAELVEPLPFHGCDAAPGARPVQCLLELQARHIRARFAVFLTGKGSPNPPGLKSPWGGVEEG